MRLTCNAPKLERTKRHAYARGDLTERCADAWCKNFSFAHLRSSNLTLVGLRVRLGGGGCCGGGWRAGVPVRFRLRIAHHQNPPNPAATTVVRKCGTSTVPKNGFYTQCPSVLGVQILLTVITPHIGPTVIFLSPFLIGRRSCLVVITTY